MADLLGTIGADLGNIFLQREKVPITISDTGQAINVHAPAPVTDAQVPVSSFLGTSAPATLSPVPTVSGAAVTADVKNLGRWTLAFIAFLGILLFLKPGEAAVLSLTIVLGALMVNANEAAKAGRPSVIQTVLGGSA